MLDCRRPSVLTAVVFAAALALSPVPAAAQSDGGQGGESAEEMAREGVQRLMDALETFLSAIPQYGVPRIEENGDIVIPRLDKREPEQPQGEAPAPSKPQDGGPSETEI